jgi:peptide/nickel transport system permease protein
MLVRLIVRRLIFLIFVLFGLSLITFGLSHIIPGDPARLMAGPRAGKSAVEKIREQYGLNDPLPTQYVTYVRNLARGDLGTSFTTRRPVSDDLKRYLPATSCRR